MQHLILSVKCTKHIVSVQCSCVPYAKMLVHNYKMEGSIQGIPVGFDSDGILWISDPLHPKNILKIVKYCQEQKHFHTRPTLLSKDNNNFPQVLFFHIMKQEMVQYFIIFNTKRQKITLTYWTVFSSQRKEILLR